MEELLRKRNRVKQKLARIVTFSTQLSAVITDTEVHLKIEMLTEIWNEFDTVQTQVECACEDTELATEQLEQEQFETNFSKTKVLLIDYLEKKSQLKSNIENQTQFRTLSNQTVTNIKLPTINLPTFNGNCQQWASFADLFKSVIHNNTNLSPVQKLHYLKTSLIGDAAKILYSVAITDANYNEAWQILSNRYSNKRQIVNSHLRTLYAQPKVTCESPKELRQLLDTTVEHLRALDALGLPTNNWDHLMTFFMTERLDSNSRRQWELETSNSDNPLFSELQTFIERRCRALEASCTERKQYEVQTGSVNKPYPAQSRKPVPTAVVYHTTTSECIKCHKQHQLFRCDQFLQLPIVDRIQWVKQASLCLNCLRPGHSLKYCKSSTCKHCGKSHNTLLHKDNNSPVSKPNDTLVVSTHSTQNTNSHQVMLATARVTVFDNLGNMHTIRALLDSGSQANFITEACVKRLQLPCTKTSINISGVAMTNAGSALKATQLILKSANLAYSCPLQALVIKNISENIPRVSVEQPKLIDAIKRYNVQLADSHYYKSDKIDILIGAASYYDIILDGKIKDNLTNLNLQNTSFGWVIAGAILDQYSSSNVQCHLAISDLTTQLQKFWEMEELPYSTLYSDEEQECEKHFNETYSRNEQGRFVVKLPLNKELGNIGNNKQAALQRLKFIERKLSSNSEHQQAYREFMKEYEDLQHMKLTTTCTTRAYYLPHHYVIREQSATTKLRVVFDGSAQPASGVSLNQVLLVGPKLQDELFNIILRFRIHNIAMTADIEKMYRQVEVHPDHYQYQHILWRTHPDLPVKDYQLQTLTYGTAAAPYLAVKCLLQLAKLEQDKYPQASAIVMSDFYVDDLLSGTDTLAEAKQVCVQLMNLLNAGGFVLHKWRSNVAELVDVSSKGSKSSQSKLIVHEVTKALGIMWNSELDTFSFDGGYSFSELINKSCSKRSILSEASKLFDPLGWLTPTTITAKLIIQRLWVAGINWDEQAPDDIKKDWTIYAMQLHSIKQINIPRQMILDSCNKNYQIVGFSDASEKAYGAAVYIRSQSNNMVQTRLVCSKARVAPLKQISLPRLELCGAVLLAKLINTTINILKLAKETVQVWTDSTIVLAWMHKPAKTWKPFVGNRVAELHDLLPPNHWNHIPSEQNPADCLTRGLLPSKLLNHSLWWNGPDWLLLPIEQWPAGQPSSETDIIETRSVQALINLNTSSQLMKNELINRYSSFNKLVRISAYCLRFIHHCKKQSIRPISTLLTTKEIIHAEHVWIKTAQLEAFFVEIQQCKRAHPLNAKSSLISLFPFCDSTGILRVGGRLHHSNLAYQSKHPIILPHCSLITNLIITEYHVKYFHAGVQLLTNLLRSKYWIINSRTIIRKIVHRCTLCFRHKVHTSHQLMGSLPNLRVIPARPFTNCGIDYAGPLTIKTHKGRGNIKQLKAYICLFVCFSTKAIHIELASDLSAQSFIAALQRFVSRRGKPANIHTDCGTNFIKANKELKELHQLINSKQYHDKVTHALTDMGINWHFNPPASPHFGGLWEAGIKSTKFHLRRTIGLTILTYEELNTLLIQVEACLNSRPLCALTNDIDDLNSLTPGHFLIGDTFVALPNRQSIDLSTSLLNRWQLVQKLASQFWNKWTKEYLSRLNQRPKWVSKQPNLKVGDLILLHQTNVSPLTWPLGRVLATHEGHDGLVRTVTIRTTQGTYKRPISKCYKLPMDDNLGG